MRRPLLSVLLTLSACAKPVVDAVTPDLSPTPEVSAMTSLAYPAAPRGTVTDTYFGTDVADPYRWLEDPDSPETRTWIAAENRLTRSWLDDVPGRDALRSRLTTLWNFARRGLPVHEGAHYFFTQNDGLQDQAVLMVADSATGAPRVLLDPNTLSDDGTVSLGEWVPSPDGRLLAYALSDGGSDWRTWHVLDVETGAVHEDTLHWSKFSGAAWLPDSSGFLYSRYAAPADPLEQVVRNQELRLHRLGTAQDDDPVVMSADDAPDWGFGGQITDDGELGLIHVWRGTEEKNLVWTFDPADPTGDVHHLIDTWDASFSVVAKVDRGLFVLTDLDAPRQRVLRINLDHPEREAWQEIIPQGPALLESASVIGGKLVLTYLEDAKNIVRIATLAGDIERDLALPGLGSVGGFGGHPDDPETFFAFSSFTQPTTLYRLDIHDDAPTPFFAPELDWDPTLYTTEQVFVDQPGGTRVPMFLSYRRDLQRDGRTPTVLYGYGGFNISITPAFSVSNAVWMEMGGVYASTTLRGGGEYGREWHEAGTKTHKQNVFDDFIACGEWLIDNGWTVSERLASKGRSNGGLLVGATLVQRPDLFGAAMPGVGVLDMLRYHKFTIGWAWASDYGTVDDSAEMFSYLRGYSPVHNTAAVAYPPTLVFTADHDDRVVPAHSFKFTAALQHAQQGPAPVMIRVETRAGHGAGKSTSMLIDEAVDEKAFLLRALDFTPVAAPSAAEPAH